MVNRILEKMYFYLQKSKNGNSYSSWYSVFFSQHGLKCVALHCTVPKESSKIEERNPRSYNYILFYLCCAAVTYVQVGQPVIHTSLPLSAAAAAAAVAVAVVLQVNLYILQIQ